MAAPLRCLQTCASRQSPAVWSQAFEALFAGLSKSPAFRKVEHIVADATSSTVLLCDSDGNALTDALMYDDQQAQVEANIIEQLLSLQDENSRNTAAVGANSTLAKVLFLLDRVSERTQTAEDNNRSVDSVQICHQIDWFNHWLTGTMGTTDENNALKLGYDPVNQVWPKWVETCLKSDLKAIKPKNRAKPAGLLDSVSTLKATLPEVTLPRVIKPGAVIAQISEQFAQQWQLSSQVQVHAGTTDSIAGFLASGAHQLGDAVSSLGSTIAVKLIAKTPVFNAKHGIYSHRLGDYWLLGGASNAGGAVLLSYFNLDSIKQHIIWLMDSDNVHHWQEQPNPHYYPLLKNGERFPIYDPSLAPKLPPKPSSTDALSSKEAHNNTLFFLGLVQGLVNIERLGYQQLEALGACPVKRIFSVGGGTQNPVWQKIRREYLQSPFTEPDSLNAAFGVTRLVSLFYKPL